MRGTRSAGALALAATLIASDAEAGEPVGACCADIEERITALEATPARKGNRAVSLAITGHVNKALLGWDDGIARSLYVVGNKNDQTALGITGDAEISSDWKAGYALTIRFLDNVSDTVDQDTDNGQQGFFVWQSHGWIESRTLGKLSLGLASRASDTAPETDLSATGVAAYAGVQDVAGGFRPRLKNGALTPLTWGDLFNHLNGDTANIVRYDTPILNGVSLAASWGEDDAWDVAIRYTGEDGGFQLEGALAYTEVSDGNDAVIGNELGLDQSTFVGSASVLHQASGLNITIAAGARDWDGAITDLDGARRTPEDMRFVYSKIGWLTRWSALGSTAFYGEYGVFEDFVCATENASLLDALDAGAGAVRIAGSTAEAWGLGIVQAVDAAEMQLYVGYRNYAAHFDLADGAGGNVSGQSVEDFHTLLAGSKITF